MSAYYAADASAPVSEQSTPAPVLVAFAGVAGAIALVAAIVAAATIWLLLTDPVTVATSVDEGELSPLLKQLGEVIYNAIAALLRFL